jgi:hypothetical protein
VGLDSAAQVQILVTVLLVILAGLVAWLGYLLGARRSRRIHDRRAAEDRAEMLTIERALKRFWDHEKQALENQVAELQKKIEFLEGKLEQYRRRAAGAGLIGLGKGKRTDMLVALLMEIEQLEEKLFLQNWKFKRELDEHLERELQHISYKRVLLSELMRQESVRSEMERYLKSSSNIRKLEAIASAEPAETETAEGEAD